MICAQCRRQVPRSAGVCPSCGAARTGTATTFELVLADRSRVPLVGELTIGRGRGNTLQLADPSVSRVHAQISLRDGPGRPVLEDTGSRAGTWVDGRRIDGPLALRDGARITLGDEQITVERRRTEAEAGRTIVVPAGASVVLSSTGEPKAAESTQSMLGTHPRLRSGYALKRLDTAEGSRRWVLKDLVGHQLVRLADSDAQLLQLVDGRRSIADLVRESEQLLGSAGPARLARLLADLSSRHLLASPAGRDADGVAGGRLSRVFRPRTWVWAGAGDWLERVYLRGGWVLFTAPALVAIAATALAGVVAFGYLIAARYGTPFVVANKVGLGGVVFLVGRMAIAALHEAAHGLMMASFGRRVGEAGGKLILIFPYAFVDTSDAWFESRPRRIAVSAAGPASDLFLGGAFSFLCLIAPAGSLRDVLFQLAFGAYYAALFNLNPLLERDGYQILADVLRQDGLRRRALDQLRRRLAGKADGSDSRVLDRYATFVVAWMVTVAAVAAVVSLHYEPTLAAVVPAPVAWSLVAVIVAAVLAPPAAVIVPSLRERRRGATP